MFTYVFLPVCLAAYSVGVSAGTKCLCRITGQFSISISSASLGDKSMLIFSAWLGEKAVRKHSVTIFSYYIAHESF